MKPVLYLFLIIVSSITLSAQNMHKYTVGNGPEDFVLDTFSSAPRLIVSCHERRDKIKKKISYFYSIDINSQQVQKMVRANEPDGFYLSLVGIDLENINGKTYLYATSCSKDDYKIVKYRIKGDSLFFIKSFSNPLLYKVNDVAVHNGNFIVSNCKYLNGSIAYCDSLGNCKTLVEHVNFPNGVFFENDSTFYYSSTFENSFVKNKLQNLTVTHSKKIAKVKGADNIIKYNGKFYVTSHPNFIKFMQHKKKSENKSPIIVYEYNADSGTLKQIYANDGNLISAVSSALVYKNNLFLSQIFDDFLLQIDFETTQPIFNSTRK